MNTDRASTITNSQLKEGYKQTEVGIIPEDWKIVALGEILSFQNGVNADKKAYGIGIPFINILEVITYPRLTVDRIPGKVLLTSQLIKTFKVESGDVLFNRTSETQEEVGLASVYLDEADVVFGGFVIRGKPNNDYLDPIFCSYVLRFPNIHSQISSRGQGAVRANIGQKELSKVKVYVPSKSEQEAIACTLSDIDALIESLDRLLTKKRQIKQGTIKTLMTGKKRLQGFGSKWKEKSIGEFADCIAGGTPSTLEPNYWGGNIRWMNSGELHLKEVFEVAGRITYDGLENSSTHLLPPNCILIGLAGQGKTRGTVAMNMVPLCTNQSIAAIIPDESCVPKFLYHNLDARYAELRELSTGDGGRGGLNLTIIRSIKIPFFEKEEQIEIANILSDMDAEIDSISAKLTKTRQLKQGMMHELLTGRIRLVDPSQGKR
jgi:type I restriction enzyme, S subunit